MSGVHRGKGKKILTVKFKINFPTLHNDKGRKQNRSFSKAQSRWSFERHAIEEFQLAELWIILSTLFAVK